LNNSNQIVFIYNQEKPDAANSILVFRKHNNQNIPALCRRPAVHLILIIPRLKKQAQAGYPPALFRQHLPETVTVSRSGQHLRNFVITEDRRDGSPPS
jgi:hypothetical protein